MSDLTIDIAKLSAELFELAKFSDAPSPEVLAASPAVVWPRENI